MNIFKQVKRGLEYLKRQDVEIRTRMLFLLEYAVLFACVIGTIAMIPFATSPIVLVPNIILIVVCLLGIYLSHHKGMYNEAAVIIVIGCAYFALPFMFFTAGGNKSGMPLWFIFGVIFTCMMLSGKLRVIMSCVSILIFGICIVVGYQYPELVTPLKNENAEFVDMFQSFVFVSIIACISLLIYIASYDNQRQILVKQSIELKKVIYTDALTGIANRHCYYNDVQVFSEGVYKEEIVVVAMDVNGLKRVNDNEGHAAGDELIKSAARIIGNAFSKNGLIYRTGGDEFMALLTCKAGSQFDPCVALENATKDYNANEGTNISIAIGVAAWIENSDKSFFELEKMADAAMYKDKSRYYRETGLDRRKR